MSKIRILPDILSNKIAAGEVVERPASVVKELVENALDAESSRIVVEIKNGGRSLIRVSDNGAGMHRDDALLSIERYATSKILSDSDLFDIRSLGFRGEALPSIASVSKFKMVTRDRDSETGTEIIVEGGKILNVAEVGTPVGTQISVEDLFFNTPARRKFMKTVATEMGHIAEGVSAAALGWPAVHFQLLHNGRAVKSWPSTKEPFDRVMDVLGREIRHDLHPISFSDPRVSIQGWVASPRLTRKTSRGISTFVNHRFVRDRTIQHALMEAYSGRLMKGEFPVAVLFLRVPAEAVDVNVHPTKHEIRFIDPKEIHAAIITAVKKAFEPADRPLQEIKRKIYIKYFMAGTPFLLQFINYVLITTSYAICSKTEDCWLQQTVALERKVIHRSHQVEFSAGNNFLPDRKIPDLSYFSTYKHDSIYFRYRPKNRTVVQ